GFLIFAGDPCPSFCPSTPPPLSEKHKVEYEVHRLVVNRDPKFTNFVEFRTHKDIYRRYAGLFFSMCVDITDNELALFVEILDHFFSNYFCELDLVFNFHKVYLILDEFILAGELQETSKKVCDIVYRILISELYQTNCLCPDINLRVHSRIGRLVLPKACAEVSSYLFCVVFLN
ncbi:hypothetical protein IFM89_037004, partial [Coptis chinensis]